MQRRTHLLLFTIIFFSVQAAFASSATVRILKDDVRSEAAAIDPNLNLEFSSGTEAAIKNNAAAATDQVLRNYDHVDPNKLIDTGLLKEALAYYDQNIALFPNRSVITIIDYGKSSTEHRMFIIDMNQGSVWALPTAHGKGSDPDGKGYATRFSNVSGSNASSLGAFRAAETYEGKNGLSLRLDGLSRTNSNARSRDIVVHGASYVKDQPVIQGRSWGCPAVPKANSAQVIRLLKNGSFIYAGFSR
jgi:hypothetical protein